MLIYESRPMSGDALVLRLIMIQYSCQAILKTLGSRVALYNIRPTIIYENRPLYWGVLVLRLLRIQVPLNHIEIINIFCVYTNIWWWKYLVLRFNYLVWRRLDLWNVKLDKKIFRFFRVQKLFYLSFFISLVKKIAETTLKTLKPYADTIPNQIWKKPNKRCFL
jgi:hypothetical protein